MTIASYMYWRILFNVLPRYGVQPWYDWSSELLKGKFSVIV